MPVNSTTEGGSRLSLYVEDPSMADFFDVEELGGAVSASGSTFATVSTFSTGSCPAGTVNCWSTMSSGS